MKKSRALISLIVFVLILGLLGYTAVFGVGSDKSGSASSIKLGLDLAGGVSITYQVVGDEKPSDEDMSDTIYKLQQRVENYSTEAQVYKEGADRINIEIQHRNTRCIRCQCDSGGVGKTRKSVFYCTDGQRRQSELWRNLRCGCGWQYRNPIYPDQNNG